MVSETILVRDFWQLDFSQVDCAARIAKLANEALRKCETVTISMDDVLGAASSFFNVILLDVAAEHGSDGITTRLQFSFGVPCRAPARAG